MYGSTADCLPGDSGGALLNFKGEILSVLANGCGEDGKWAYDIVTNGFQGAFYPRARIATFVNTQTEAFRNFVRERAGEGERGEGRGG